jgi:nitrite reductase/ring-hydroxylating ferredoxin subunit
MSDEEQWPPLVPEEDTRFLPGPNPEYWRLRPRAPMPGAVLGPLHEIPEDRGREYVFGRGKSAFSMFVIRKGSQVWGYLNICPHFSLPLNYRAGQFMNEDATLIRCSMHFAEFRIEDGFCVSGAAENCYLDPVPLHIDSENRVVIGPG